MNYARLRPRFMAAPKTDLSADLWTQIRKRILWTPVSHKSGELRFVCHDLRTVFHGSELRSVEKSTSHESERGDVRIMTYSDRARGVRYFCNPSSRQSRDAAQAVPASTLAAGAALNEPWQADIKC